MPTLIVVRRSQIDAIESAWCIGIGRIWIVVDLDVRTKSVSAMFGVVQCLTMKNHTGTVEVGNAVTGWKIVEFSRRFCVGSEKSK